MRRTIQGYLDMGPVQIPPLPEYIVMVDRSDGQHYVLTHDGADVVLSTTIPNSKELTVFGPYDGPYLNGNIRLFVSSGVLSAVEVDVRYARYYNHRVYARLGMSRTIIEITAPETWVNGDALVYTPDIL